MKTPGVLLASIVLCVLSGAAGAQIEGQIPEELDGLDLVDRSGAIVPADLRLVDEAGTPVRIGDFLNRGKPLLVQMVYYECPMLCTLVLNAYLEAARELDWTPGREYDVLTVSFDPTDSPALAAAKKKNYVAALEKPGAEAGWHFLTGDSASIRALTDTLGFGYRWMEDKKEFAHAAGMFVLTPQGKISRTLYGISFAAKDVRLSLVEAGEGLLGSPFDKLLLYCFQYDPETHKYALVAVNAMKLGGLGTVILMGVFLTVQWTRERRRSREAIA